MRAASSSGTLTLCGVYQATCGLLYLKHIFLKGVKQVGSYYIYFFFIIFVFVEGIVCKVVSELGENNVGLAHAPYEELKQLCVYI